MWRSKLNRYEAHVVVEKEAVNKPKSSVGIDLGLKKIITAYETKGKGKGKEQGIARRTVFSSLRSRSTKNSSFA